MVYQRGYTPISAQTVKYLDYLALEDAAREVHVPEELGGSGSDSDSEDEKSADDLALQFLSHIYRETTELGAPSWMTEYLSAQQSRFVFEIEEERKEERRPEREAADIIRTPWMQSSGSPSSGSTAIALRQRFDAEPQVQLVPYRRISRDYLLTWLNRY
jgi:hypothetical protein